MRHNSKHTIWLTLLTSLMFLISSVVNSAPLMNIEMMSKGMMSHGQSMMDHSEPCGMSNMTDLALSAENDINDHHVKTSPQAETNMNCGGSTSMVHTCCTAACSIVFTPLPIPDNRTTPIEQRASVTPEQISPVVQVSRDLFRPPIA
ncbi:hypothetical protein A3K86_19215 [Photobacterium jeanii]|uniref:Uncharacterized protein n=1 Tax=Photobacterium jeanii TaxID=858640 RepID=A0A178K2Z9_9GAMM|nr:hypothetical protein [Photobacterium jeanii]OAN11103.1 hypothetical protein A3K86_19215 [Photobacterium jeanii]PST90618.1 hypothetical protein C9I91_08315 [Photobacterium jeanii]